MATYQQLKDLAHLRLREAEALFAAELYDGAKYLSGYVVELALKARICRVLDVDDYAMTQTGTDMDHDALIAGLKKVAADIEAKEGPLALFMLVAPDAETGDAWNVIVSAHGFDMKSRGNAVRQVSDWLRQNVSESEWPRIARATVLRTNDPFVQAMNSAFHAEESVINLQACNISGIDIPRAVLLESKRVAA
jgi:hypothetical protein